MMTMTESEQFQNAITTTTTTAQMKKNTKKNNKIDAVPNTKQIIIQSNYNNESQTT